MLRISMLPSVHFHQTKIRIPLHGRLDPTADPFTFRMLRHFNIPLGEVREWHRICGKEWAQRKPQAIRNTNPESRGENGKQAGDARYFI
jgi:hypothetical protein